MHRRFFRSGALLGVFAAKIAGATLAARGLAYAQETTPAEQTTPPIVGRPRPALPP